MVDALVVVREHDEETDSYAVLDMIKFEVPQVPKAIRKKLDETLTRFFVDAQRRRSDIHSITIEFQRNKEKG